MRAYYNMAQENDLLLNELLPEADLEEADHRDRVGAIGVPVLLEEDCDSEPDFKEFERVLTGLKAKHKVPPKYNKQRLEFLLQRYSQDFKTHYPPPKHSFNSKLNLPINRVLPQILRAILENQVAIVTGETGCGKSTQIPQLLLDYLETSETEGKVMVIQPRRLAAINLAISIAKQTGTRIGGLVGYSIRMDHKASRSTRVLMTTYGMFLQKLTHSPSLLEEYPFVLLDEVHERDIDSDFIILALKHLLPEYPRVRLLLMSATIDTSLFESYFAKDEIDSMRARENYYFRLMRVQAKLKKL
jgi:HrpA-like RNA helicase